MANAHHGGIWLSEDSAKQWTSVPGTENYAQEIVALVLERLTDPDPQMERKKRISVLAHELGHVYGLHERYIHQDNGGVTCNSNEVTVMDAAGCDGWLEGPASLDVNRVNNFWSQGFLYYLDINPVNGRAEASWYDFAWGDWSNDLAWFWWDAATSSWRWVGAWDEMLNNIGFHYGYVEDPPRHLTQLLDRSKFPNAPVNKWYTFCGNPWFASYQTAGDWDCTQFMVWVTQ